MRDKQGHLVHNISRHTGHSSIIKNKLEESLVLSSVYFTNSEQPRRRHRSRREGATGIPLRQERGFLPAQDSVRMYWLSDLKRQNHWDWLISSCLGAAASSHPNGMVLFFFHFTLPVLTRCMHACMCVYVCQWLGRLCVHVFVNISVTDSCRTRILLCVSLWTNLNVWLNTWKDRPSNPLIHLCVVDIMIESRWNATGLKKEPYIRYSNLFFRPLIPGKPEDIQE